MWYLASEEANIGRKGCEPWGCSFTVSMSIFAGAIDMHHNRLAQSKPVRRPFSIRWQRRIQQPAAERGAAGNKTAVFHKSALNLYWFTHQQKGWVTWCTAMAYILTLRPLYCCSLATWQPSHMCIYDQIICTDNPHAEWHVFISE